MENVKEDGIVGFEYNIKKDNSIYNEKTNLLHELEIEVNRADVKLDTLLSTLNETYSMTYEKAVSLYKLDFFILQRLLCHKNDSIFLHYFIKDFKSVFLPEIIGLRILFINTQTYFFHS